MNFTLVEVERIIRDERISWLLTIANALEKEAYRLAVNAPDLNTANAIGALGRHFSNVVRAMRDDFR